MGMRKRDIIFRANLKTGGTPAYKGGPTKGIGSWNSIRDIAVLRANYPVHYYDFAQHHWRQADDNRLYICAISSHTGRPLTPSLALLPDDLDQFCIEWLKSRNLIEEV